MKTPPPRILDISLQLPWLAKPGFLNRASFSVLERVLGFRKLNAPYFSDALENATGLTYPARLLEELDISVRSEGADDRVIPADGPVVFVANHPFGGADAMALASLIFRTRPEGKILANQFLSSIDIIRPHLITVDVDGGVGAVQRNLKQIRAIKSHLAEGQALGVFPAGEVSSWSAEKKRVADPEWSNQIARLAEKAAATIVPIFFRGQNSALFQALGRVHPFLRTAWLARELLRLRGKTVEMVVGEPFAMKAEIDLRERVERLANLSANPPLS